MSRRCPWNKRRYQDEFAAMLALSQRDHEVVRAYECPECKGWHLTSQPRDNAVVRVRE